MPLTVDEWLWCLVRTSVGVAASVLVLATAFRLLRVRSPGVQRVAIVLVLLQGWVLWQVPFVIETTSLPQTDKVATTREPLSSRVEPHREPASADSARFTPMPASRQADDSAVVTLTPDVVVKPTPATRIPWRPIILLLWTLGGFVTIAATLLRYSRFIRSMRTLDAPPADWAAQWHALRGELGLAPATSLWVSDGAGPCVYWQPAGYRVVVPRELWSSLTATERRRVLRHEAAHIQRHDLWKSWAARILAAPQWFNPLAWWAVRRFDECAEWACDEAAAEGSLSRAAEFTRVLLKLGTREVSSPVPGARRGSVSQRIRRLLSRERPERRRQQIVVLSIAAAMAVVQGARIELIAQPSAEGNTQIAQTSQAAQQPVFDAQQPAAGDLLATLGAGPGRIWTSWPDPQVTWDGRRVFLGGPRGFVSIYDARSLELVSRFEAHEQRCLQVHLVDDGRELVSLSRDGTIRLWDVAATKPRLLDEWDVPQPRGDSSWVRMAVALHGRLLAICRAEELFLVEVEDSHFVQRDSLALKTGPDNFALLDDGTRLATSERVPFPGGNIPPERIVSKAGGIRYGLHDIRLSLWNLEPDKPELLDDQVVPAVSRLLFLRDGKRLLGGDPHFLPDRKTRAWYIDNDRLEPGLPLDYAWQAHRMPAFNSEGTRMAVQSQDGHFEILRVDQDPIQTVHRLNKLPSSARGIAFVPYSESLIAANSPLLLRWELTDGEYRHRGLPKGQQAYVQDVLFDDSQRVLLSVGRDAILGWDLSTPTSHWGSAQPTKLALGGAKQIDRWPNHDGLLIHNRSGNNIAIVERVNGQYQRRHFLDFGDDYQRAAWTSALHPSGKILATGHWDDSIRFWELSAEEPFMRSELTKAHRGHVCKIVYSPDGDLLASVGWDHKVKLIDTSKAEPRPIKTLGKHQDVVRSAAFSPDGRYLASGGEDGQILLWDLESDEDDAPAVFRHPEDPPKHVKMEYPTVTSLEFSQDGSRLLSADGQGRVTLWSAPTGEIQKVWRMPGWVHAARFCDKERLIASGNADGTVSVWRTPKPR